MVPRYLNKVSLPLKKILFRIVRFLYCIHYSVWILNIVHISLFNTFIRTWKYNIHTSLLSTIQAGENGGFSIYQGMSR